MDQLIRAQIGGVLFQVARRFVSGYTETKRPGGLPQGLIRAQIGDVLFQVAGAFCFRLRQSGNRFCCYTGDPRTENKRPGVLPQGR